MVTSMIKPKRLSLFFLAVLLALSAPAAGLQQKNALVGAWRANIEKSKRHPNHLFKSMTLRFEASGEEVLLTYAGVNMSGAEETGTFKIHPDGKEHPIPGAPGLVEVSKWASARNLETTAKQDGKVVGHSSYEIGRASCRERVYVLV